MLTGDCDEVPEQADGHRQGSTDGGAAHGVRRSAGRGEPDRRRPRSWRVPAGVDAAEDVSAEAAHHHSAQAEDTVPDRGTHLGQRRRGPASAQAPAEVLGESENRAGGSGSGEGEGEGGAGQSGASEDRSIVATGLATVVDLSPGWVAASAGLSALLILLLLAAAQLFNDALKNHHDEIVRQLADRTTISGRLSLLVRAIPNPPVVVTFAATAGLLGLLANPGVNFSVSTLAQMVGMMLAIGAIALVYDGIARRVIDREIGVQSRFRLYPLAIFVAVICLLLSRFLSVSPGVLYGLFIGIAVGGAVSSRLVGRAYATSSLALIGVAVLAFLLHKWVAPDAGVQDPSFWAIVIDTAAAVLVVGGLQAVIVQLIPTRFVNGENIFKWSRAGWAALAVTAMTLYMVIVVRPNPNQQSFGNLWFVVGSGGRGPPVLDLGDLPSPQAHA